MSNDPLGGLAKLATQRFATALVGLRDTGDNVGLRAAWTIRAYERGITCLILEQLRPGVTGHRRERWTEATEGLASGRINRSALICAGELGEATGQAQPSVPHPRTPPH